MASEKINADHREIVDSGFNERANSAKIDKKARFHLATSVRNEGLYILEWLAHHLFLGFDKVYVFSNNNTDGSDQLLAALQDHKFIDWRPRELKPDESPQQTAFTTLSAELLPNSEALNDYLIWLDCDEFLVLKKHQTISELVKHLNYPDGIFFNWKSFGSSNEESYRPESLTIEKFLYWDPKTSYNRFGKCMAKIDPQLFRQINHHRPLPKPNTTPNVIYATEAPVVRTLPDDILHRGKNAREIESAPIEYGLAQLNHYATRSEEEQNWKAERGPGYNVGSQKFKRYAKKLSNLSINNTTFEDEAPERYSQGVRTILAKMPEAVTQISKNIQRKAAAQVSQKPEDENLTKTPTSAVENIQHHTHHLKEMEKRLAAAEEICRYLSMVGISPKSVLDVGCGFGFFLAEADKKWNLDRLTGVDGDWIEPETLQIPPQHYISLNLAEQTFSTDERFDLTVCLEVAEHLPKDIADRFVASLAATSDIVLFSAAFPGQGGKSHFNEQPMSYWAKKFGAEGFQPVDILHDFVWQSETLFPWFRNNLVIFASSNALEKYHHFSRFLVNPNVLDRIHPHYYNRERRRLREASSGKDAK